MQTDSDRIVNRHKARLLSELEDARCPDVYLQAVRSKLDWLRSDLHDLATRTTDPTDAKGPPHDHESDR